MSYRNIGIDLGVTAKHKAQIRDEEGNFITEFSFYLSKENLDALCQKALLNAEPETKLRFICEPTEMSWFPLAIYVKTHNYEMVRVKSHKTHDLRKYYARNKKSDSLDAEILSRIPNIDQKAIEQIYLPDADTQALERANRQKEKIIKDITAIKNRISSIYHWIMPGVLDCFEDKFGSRALAFHGHFINPFLVKTSGIKGIKKFLEHKGREKMKENLPEKIYNIACNSCKLYDNSSANINFLEMQEEMNTYIELLRANEEILDKVKQRIERLYQKVHPTKNIESIKGIGANLGASIIGAIGNPERFLSQSKIRCYAGIIPEQDDSGETSKKGLPITQEGPSRLRCDLFLAAESARQWDPQLAKVYYEAMVYKGQHHYQAVCAVMTKLLNRILCILKENRKYELRDLAGNPIEAKEAKELIKQKFSVPEEVRRRTRARKNSKNKKEQYLDNLLQRQQIKAPQNCCIAP